MGHPSLTIARYTLLEALRTRLLWLTALALLTLLAGSAFVQQLAIAEGVRFQTAFLAATARPAAVFLIALYVISSMAREFHDKGVELILALDLSRASFVLGKLAGFAALAVFFAVASCLPVALFAPLGKALLWGVSLLCELWIIAALSLFCAVTFSQVVPASSFVLGFYLLARSISALQLIGGSALLDDGSRLHQAMLGALNALALALPHLDTFTRTAWLVNPGADWGQIAPILLQTLIYCGILAAATLFDMYRRNF